MKDAKRYGFTTTILHGDRRKPIEHGALHKPVHTSVAFMYDDARSLAAVFQGKQPGFRYGRMGNPTVSALEDKITGMEQGLGTLCFSSGMAAIAAVVHSLLRQGDHVVSSSFIFSNTNSLWQTVCGQGIPVSLVDATSVDAVEAALSPATRVVFVETIANPCTQVADLQRIGALCRERGILFVVDNTLTTPYFFCPKSVGASLVVNSLTKWIGGHGNALGGSLTDTGLFDWASFPNILPAYRRGAHEYWGLIQIRAKGLRDFGAALAPEAAHRIAVGAETMSLRMERASANACALATALKADPRVAAVHFPGLASHPQHELAADLFDGYGGMFSFELDGRIDCFDFLARLQVAIPGSSLGDTRTLVIPVAHTIFHEMGPARRSAMGIADSLIRVSTGIEETKDLLDDFMQALDGHNADIAVPVS